jgi:hypothetical protein
VRVCVTTRTLYIKCLYLEASHSGHLCVCVCVCMCVCMCVCARVYSCPL